MDALCQKNLCAERIEMGNDPAHWTDRRAGLACTNLAPSRENNLQAEPFQVVTGVTNEPRRQSRWGLGIARNALRQKMR